MQREIPSALPRTRQETVVTGKREARRPATGSAEVALWAAHATPMLFRLSLRLNMRILRFDARQKSEGDR